MENEMRKKGMQTKGRDDYVSKNSSPGEEKED